MEHLSQPSDNPIKCDACGSNKTKGRVIWLDPMDGQIYPKIKLQELITFLVLMGFSLGWFIITVVYHQNPFLMIVSVVFFISFITVNAVQLQRYLLRKKYEETWFYNCKNCGNQWMAPYDPDSTTPD
jgi:uncharacterized membrane protein